MSERFTNLTSMPENAARIGMNSFYPVEPHWGFSAGATCEAVPSPVDVGLLVFSGALRVQLDDEPVGQTPMDKPHQLYYPSQFCRVPAGKKLRWEALIADTSFYWITLQPPVFQPETELSR